MTQVTDEDIAAYCGLFDLDPNEINVEAHARDIAFFTAHREAAFNAGLERAAGWQPIESAPRDGAWFLGFWPDCNEAQNRFCPTSWLDDGDESRFIDDSDWRDWQQPTHWQPLPAPPAAKEPSNG